jgi:phosphoserine phosphatase
MRKLLVCFDVDGTLIDDTIFIWQTLHDKLLTDPLEREKWSQAYWSGKISYAEWARKDVDMWMAKNVGRSEIEKAMSDLHPMQNTIPTLTVLKNLQHCLGIISGSLDIALTKAIPEFEHFFSYVYLNKLIFDYNGKLIGIKPTPFDIEHKATGLIKMAEEAGIPLQNTVYIGDNFNDIEVAKTAGCSIAFNCKSEDLEIVSDHVVPGTDLSDIIPYILDYAEKSDQIEPNDA